MSFEHDSLGWTLMPVELPLGLIIGGHLWGTVCEGAAHVRRGDWLLLLHLQWSRNEYSDVGCWLRVKLERPGHKRKPTARQR